MPFNLRAGTQAQRTAAQVPATTQAAPACLAPSGPRVSPQGPGLPILQQHLITEGPITSPHPHVPLGLLFSIQLPPEPPSLALEEEEEARGLRLEVPSSPLMLSLWVLEHITKVEATTQVAARVDLIVAHQA